MKFKLRRAFTLVELLVVISIVAVMAGIALPALSKAKAKVKTIVCLNNLRQWGVATQLYVVDHDGYLPAEGVPNPSARHTNVGWYVSLPKQLGIPPYHQMEWRTNVSAEVSGVWICPSNRRRSNGNNLFHYCLNESVNGVGADNRPVRLESIDEVSRVVWLFDSKNLPAVGSRNYTHTNLHGGGAQFLFLDGHISRLPRSAYWDDERNRARTNQVELIWAPE